MTLCSSSRPEKYLYKLAGDAKFDAFTKCIQIPDDIHEVIYDNYQKLKFADDIKRKCKSPIFYNSTRDDDRSTRLFAIFEEKLQHRLTMESWYALSTIFLSVEHSELWKYATKKTKAILEKEIKSSRIYVWEGHFKFCTSRQVDFETCILHIIYMNEHGMDRYFEKVDKEWFRWGGNQSTELWNKH